MVTNNIVITMKKAFPFTKAAAFRLLTVASLFALPACGGPKSTTTAAEDANVTAEELVEETSDYVGEEVTIRAEVESVINEFSFLMVSDDYLDGEGVLVINASSEPFLIPDVGDSQLQVTGKVQSFAMLQIAEEYGLTLEPELYEKYEEKPVIIAESIALAPDPDDITENPELFYNQQIAIKGEVEELFESGLFRIGEPGLFSGEPLLVIPAAGTKTAKADEIVVVTGILRPYIKAEFEKDYDLQWDLSVKESIDAEYEQKPVFVADGVYPSAVP